MDYSTTGLVLLEKGDATRALAAFTKALIEHPTSPDYYNNRSKAFARLSPGRHDLALQDAEHAILYARQRGSGQKMQDGQLRRIIALYNHGQYAAARKLLTFSSKWGNAQMFKMWDAKVEQKMKTLPEDKKAEVDISEMPQIPLPSAQEAMASLKRQINPDGSFNFDAAEGKEVPAANAPDAAESAVPPTSSAATNPGTIVIRQDWFQTGTTVTITLFAKGVDNNKFTANIQDDSLDISFPNPGNTASEYSFSVDPFYALINAAQSKANVLKTKVEIVLIKAIPNQKWATLEGTEPLAKSGEATEPAKAVPQSVLQKATAPSYPTSSKTGAKNWDKLAADLTKKDKKDKKAKTDENGSASEGEDAMAYDSDEGGDEVDGFFKKLYSGSDPDTQRAMMKSYYESGGTTLSTNWDEVGKKRIEPYVSERD